MKSKLVESKQEYSMQLYQMKEELRLMEEENKNLSGMYCGRMVQTT